MDIDIHIARQRKLRVFISINRYGLVALSIIFVVLIIDSKQHRSPANPERCWKEFSVVGFLTNLEYMMMQTSANDPRRAAAFLTTEQLASLLAMRPQSIRKRLNQTGSYFGIVPIKLLNNRLAWPLESIDQLKKNGQGE